MTAAEQTLFDTALKQAFDTVRRTIPRMGTDRPSIGRDDMTYVRGSNSDWVASFWSGQLWLPYSETRDPIFMDAALRQRPYFFRRLDCPETHDHDLGFLYTLSLVAEHKLTGDADARRGALQAADSLAGRYNRAGRFIRAWNDWSEDILNQGRIIIDCMENLALLFWASETSGRPHYAEIAVEHARTSAKYLIREDGSSYHSYVFDPDTGQPLRGETVQGYADESCWSRGQSWGIHGFTLAYVYTGDSQFRDLSVRLADYAIPRLPEDGVPYWDYLLPEDAPDYRDSSAGAIMAAGLFLLADQLTDAKQAAHYRDAARKILTGLVEGYTTANYPDAEGLLLQGASHISRGRANNMLPYGDYFYIEALLRAMERTAFFW
jgi:unsaturated chondroitin disaccharide hydrolase